MLKIAAEAQREIQALLNSLHHTKNISQQLVLLVHKNYESITVSAVFPTTLTQSVPNHTCCSNKVGFFVCFCFLDCFNGRKLNSYNSW